MIKNKVCRWTFLSTILCLFFAPATAVGQTVTGMISGTVTDASGQIIQNATVTLVSERTGDRRTVTTNDAGGFVFAAAPPGIYTITVDQRGFRKFERKGNVLTANEHLSVGNIALVIGELSETVTTTASVTPVQTESAEHSALISSKQLETISIRGRDVVSLLRILPGVSLQGQSEAGGGSGGGSQIPNIQGGRGMFSVVNVDGVRGNDLGGPDFFGSTVNFDAIAEVKVLLNGYQAEYANNAGAGINIITKSGSREYHGGGYWYKRHEMLNANRFFNNAEGRNADGSEKFPRPFSRFSTLGFTLGGPVWIPKATKKIKEKLFFFYSFEDARTSSPQDLRRVTVPTERERQGDFSQTGTVIRDPRTGQPFLGNAIPDDRINKNGQALLNVFPLPNANGGVFNYVFQESLKIPKRQHVLRTDYRMSEKDSFYVRGSTWYADTQGVAVPAGTANWGLARLHYTYTDNGITGNWTHLFTSSLVNEASVGLRHSVENGPPVDESDLAKLQRSTYGFTLGQFNPQLNPLGILPRVTLGTPIQNAAEITYDGRTPLRGADTLISFTDTLSWIRGKHTFKAGVYVERVRNYEGETSTFAGNFSFTADPNNPLNSGHPYANAILGNFTAYSESTARPRGDGRQTLVEWFVQDSWKATRRLTLEYGVRFAWYNHWYQDRGEAAAAFSIDHYDRSRAPVLFQPACSIPLPSNGRCPDANLRAINPITGELFPRVFTGAFVPGTGDPHNGMVLGTDETYPRGFRDQQPVQAQPRLGFAWDVAGNGKTAIRGSFGVFNQARVSANAVWLDASRNPPINETPTIIYGNMDTLFSAGGVLFPGEVTGFDRGSKTPVTYNYSLGVQRDIGFGAVAEVAYVGSVSRHLQTFRNLNTIPYGTRFLPQSMNPVLAGSPLPINFLRPFPGYGSIFYFENVGVSNYNAMQVSANRRFTRGLQFGVAYTWSKAMSEVDDDRFSPSTPVYRPRRIWNYGKASFDQTHVLVINYTLEAPKLSRVWNKRLVRGIFDGWQVSGMTAFASGVPKEINFSIAGNPDITGGGDGARLWITGNPVLPRGERTPDRWFNTSAFAPPRRGEVGNAPKDVIRLPGTNNWDVSIFKNFNLWSESRYLQFRWEIYNVFNHTQFSNVDNNAVFNANGVQTNNQFGRVNGARDPRTMQLALRLTF
jgi:Carboxypeptidase regulatory-like domain/TonB-dependent Receptor Plug Domain